LTHVRDDVKRCVAPLASIALTHDRACHLLVRAVNASSLSALAVLAAGLALVLAAATGAVACHGGSSGNAVADASATDSGDEMAMPCNEAGAFDSGVDAATVTLPTACALPPQGCNPLDATGCDTSGGQTCDLARTGSFECAPVGSAGPAALGAACDGLAGPFCGPSLTCLAGQCVTFCCADSDCSGSGSCVPLPAMRASGGNVGTCVAPGADDAGAPDATPVDAGADGGPTVVGNHVAVFEGRGFLVPWTSWSDAITRELAWYQTTCGQVSGYPVFATAVHLDGNCQLSKDDAIPAMQDGTGILSYLEYYQLGNRQNPQLLAVARSIADYLVGEAVTPDAGAYPAFPRSTGQAEAVPQPPDCGTQDDQPYEIEPDKGGIAGHALMMLAAETGDATYSTAALHIAQTLAATMVAGTPSSTPWPFRADYRTGAGRGVVSSNLSYILRLFDDLLPAHPELSKPRAQLWSYIKNVQIPDLSCSGYPLWVQFFEDGDFELNRNAWAPLSLARYLLEQQSALDPDWQADTAALLDFVNENFVDVIQGFPVCVEQDFDREPFGGILSTYGAVNAMYAKVAGTTPQRLHAYQALTILVYAINDDGCPVDLALSAGRGGWQEDAHLDKLHNFADALNAFPDWAN
jgi:hypothetical protein